MREQSPVSEEHNPCVALECSAVGVVQLVRLATAVVEPTQAPAQESGKLLALPLFR